MLKIQQKHENLAIYLTERILLEDALWRVLFRHGKAFTLKELADSVHLSVGYPVPEERLDWLLHRCSRRFQFEGGQWELTIWHIPEKRTFIAKAKAIMELSGLPIQTKDLAALLRRSPEVVDKVLQNEKTTFKKLEEHWFLLRWLNWEYPNESENLLDQLLEPDTRSIPIKIQTRSEACIDMLSHLGVAVSTGYLRWALEREGMTLNPVFLFRDKRFLLLSDGHWLLERRIPSLVTRFSQIDLDYLERSEKQVEQLSHEAELTQLERKLCAEIQRLKGRAISVLSRIPLTVEELYLQLGLDKWIMGIKTGEAEQVQLEVIAKSEIMRQLEEEDIVRLPGKRLFNLPPECIDKIINYMESGLFNLTVEEILSMVLKLDLENEDRTIVLDVMQKRLGQCSELELADNHWHLSRKQLKERLNDKVLMSLLKILRSSDDPITLRKLIECEFGQSLTSGSATEILLTVCEQTLINDKRFWKLGNGLWWASPEWLATDNRLQDLKKQRINHPYLAIEKLISLACSLRLNELSSEEKNLLMRAFSKKLLSLEPSFLQTDNVERKIPSEKPEIRIVPPKRIRFTLTDERIRKGRIPITPGLVQILSACQCASGIELTTFADFILRAQINKTDRCLEGRDIAKWYNEEKLAPGDIVYVCAPEGERGTMRLFTAFEVRTGEKMTHKVETQGHNPMYLRDRIHQILEQNGKIMTVLELCIVLSKSLGSEVNHGSVSGALNYNSHLFVGWGGKHWGLIEWGQDWRSRVDKEALLMRISEEDLVVEILKDFRRWITNRQIANEIAKKFVLTSDFVLETSFIDTNDDRLCRRGESWGLLDWTKPCGFSWFAPLQDDSNFKLLVDEWLLQKWGIKLGELAKEVGIAQKN